MTPEYRYFRRNTGALYKLQTKNPDQYRGNTWSKDEGITWNSTVFHLADMLDTGWGGEGQPVEYFPNAPQPSDIDTQQPTYRFFRQGKGEWKVQTTDPESTEGNFYRNAETPWLSASHSLSDLLTMGATEVGASEEQVPSWAVAAVITKADQKPGTMHHFLEIFKADTQEQALGMFTTEVYHAFPGCQLQKPLIGRVP